MLTHDILTTLVNLAESGVEIYSNKLLKYEDNTVMKSYLTGRIDGIKEVLSYLNALKNTTSHKSMSKINHHQ